MNLFVDTSVWSLALRRDGDVADPAVVRLREALSSGGTVFTTGVVLQELLQGFHEPRSRSAILEAFAPLPLLAPEHADYVSAAELRNQCRRGGVQLGTIDALLAQLCIQHDLHMLTTDGDFEHATSHIPLRLWSTA